MARFVQRPGLRGSRATPKTFEESSARLQYLGAGLYEDTTSGAEPPAANPKGPLTHPFFGPFRGPLQ